MAVPLHHRRIRRCGVCLALPGVPYYFGTARHGDGVRGRACGAEVGGAGVRQVATIAQMALVLLVGLHRLHGAHDVLHDRVRLDGFLRAEDGVGRVRRGGRPGDGERVLGNACRPGGSCRVDGDRSCDRRRRVRHGAAEGRRARYQVDDGDAVRGHARTLHPCGDAARRQRGNRLLPRARFLAPVRGCHARRAMGDLRRRGVRGHGTGVLLAVARHCRDGDLRVLYRAGAQFDRRGGFGDRAQHRGRHPGRAHHLPRLFRVRRKP